MSLLHLHSGRSQAPPGIFGQPGHVPFAIELLGMGIYHGEYAVVDSGTYQYVDVPTEFALQLNGVDVGPDPFTLHSLEGAAVDLSAHGIVVPAVTLANIDGAGRWGLRATPSVPVDLGFVFGDYPEVWFSWRAVDLAHRGKDLHSIGGVFDVSSTTPFLHAPGGPIAPSPFALTAPSRGPNDRRPLVALPLPVPCRFADFHVYLPGDAEGDSEVRLRRGGTIVSTIEIPNGSPNRIFLPDVEAVQLAANSRIDFEFVSTVDAIEAQIVFTITPFGTLVADGDMGFAESFGESGAG